MHSTLIKEEVWSEDELNIDESRHRRVPTIKERTFYALLSLLLSFLLINLVLFWMFPGAGFMGLYFLSTAHSSMRVVGELTKIISYTIMASCTLLGWFQGKYFTDRLQSMITQWKIW